MPTAALAGGCDSCRLKDRCGLYLGQSGGRCLLITSETARGRNPAPSLATTDESAPDMANYPNPSMNGESKSLIPTIKQIIGEVRVGWIVFTVVASSFLNLAATLITHGWIIPPAKSSDVVAVMADVKSIKGSIELLNPAVLKLTEAVSGLKASYESADRKLDRLIDRPAYPVAIHATHDDDRRPPSAPAQARKRPQPQKAGVLGF